MTIDQVKLASSKKRSVGAEEEGEGNPKRKTEPISRQSLTDFILVLFEKLVNLKWFRLVSSCRDAHEH